MCIDDSFENSSLFVLFRSSHSIVFGFEILLCKGLNVFEGLKPAGNRKRCVDLYMQDCVCPSSANLNNRICSTYSYTRPPGLEVKLSAGQACGYAFRLNPCLALLWQWEATMLREFRLALVHSISVPWLHSNGHSKALPREIGVLSLRAGNSMILDRSNFSAVLRYVVSSQEICPVRVLFSPVIYFQQWKSTEAHRRYE